MSEGIGLEQAKTRVGDSHCKMREVINDKGKHDKPAHHHVTRGEVCFHVMPIEVAFRSRAAILNSQLNRHVNMNGDRREEKQTDCPQQWAQIAQVLRVTVDPIRTQKNLQIAEQMSDYKK